MDEVTPETLTQDIRHAERELIVWRKKVDTAEDEGQRKAAQAWVSWYSTQIARGRTQLAALRRLVPKL